MGEKGTKTKKLIVRAAYQIFAEKGFKEVTMKDICEKTGLSRGGLYRHYSGTSEIFAEILTKEYVIEDRIERKESAKRILEDMFDLLEKEILEKDLSLSLAIYEYASAGNEEFFIAINEKAKKRWMDLIQYGIETGEFKKVNPEQVTDMILFYYQGLRMWSRVIPFTQKNASYYLQTIRQMLLF